MPDIAHRASGSARCTATLAALGALGALSGCTFALSYPPVEIEVCGNDRDDDLDGLRDCADPECDGMCVEAGALCTDERDNDRDGRIDWRDPRCWSSAAIVEVDTCTSIAGGDWDLPPELGVVWVADRSVRVEPVSPDTSALVAADGTNVDLLSRPVTTGRVSGMTATVDLAFLPPGGATLVDLVDPESPVDVPPRLTATVVSEGLWSIEIAPFDFFAGGFVTETTLDVEALTTQPLTLRLELLPARRRTAGRWQVLREGVVLTEYDYGAPDNADPLVVRVQLARNAGLSSAHVTRPTYDVCDGVSRPEPALQSDQSFPMAVPDAALQPDGAICVLIPHLRQWRRFPRDPEGNVPLDSSELLRAIPDAEPADVDAMYIDEAGTVHALATVGSAIRRFEARACGESLTMLPEPITVLDPPSATMNLVGFSRDGSTEEILFDVSSADGRDRVIATALAGSTATFVVGPPVASGYFTGSATRLGDDWVASSFDGSGGIQLLTVGDPSPFASMSPSRTAGAWISELPGTLVWQRDASPDRIEGVWLRNTHVAARPAGSQLGGVVATRVTVVPRPE